MAISKIVYKSSPSATGEVWMDATSATASASDILSPLTAMLANGVVTQGTGTGGSSNLVTGTFEGTTADKGTAISISVPYTGNGYPIIGIVYPSGGAYQGDIAALAQKSAEWIFAFVKSDFSAVPTYNGSLYENQYLVTAQYKYSDSDPTSSSTGRGLNTNLCYHYAASESYSSCFRFSSATNATAYIANTSYGFPAGIEFTYKILYSS